MHAFEKMRHLNYSTYVMTRTDFHYFCNFYIPQLQSCVHSANIENYGGINDRHIVIPRRHLHILSSMQNIAQRASPTQGLWCFRCHTERILLLLARQSSIRICHYRLSMFLVRHSGDIARSEKGRGNSVQCQNQTYRVKYNREFAFALKQCQVNCSRGHNKSFSKTLIE
jgi:hypothetical protein